ncbi:related to light induced alcohol dehydrogenase Bli-4 [Armillaria ostoyae]|uniref:Related to light induced alcohol dehydrogenase Bli-4 n=1 Tax=Armillaria ostoyae TaxID=47428 RepID=A0A284RE17_ARMOS|nr:related to light induced alcohol dehydrogenase Bli-4 [Armillaria ostoyae]
MASSSRVGDENSLLDLTEKVAVVTGANSGIGLYILFHVARAGARVYLGARTEDKFNGAITRLKTEGLDTSKVVWLPFDLSDPRKAKESAKWLLERESRLDILINNAAKILGPYAQTSDGLSDSMVINHMSPYLFTKTLLPLLESTARQPGSDVRIVNVSSVAHRWVPNPRYDSLEAFNNDFADTWKPKTNLYGYTKLANVLWTKELQRSFDRANIPILAMTVHPGNVMSEGNVKLFTSLMFGTIINWVFSLFFISPFDGGYTPAWAAASRAIAEDRRKYAGAYLVPFGVIEEASEDARRENLAKDLLATTDAVLKQYDYA